MNKFYKALLKNLISNKLNEDWDLDFYEPEEPLVESQESQKNLQSLADSILLSIAESFNEFTPYNDKITSIPYVTTMGINYSEIDPKYKEIFYKKEPLQIWPKLTNRSGDLGAYYPNLKKIELFYDSDFLEKLIPIKKDRLAVYAKLHTRFFTTLLHELQHAYDDIISGGKAMNTKSDREFSKQQHLLSQNIDKKLKAEIYKNYLRLPSEVNARFAEAIYSTPLWDITDWETFKTDSIDFKTVLKDFKEHFTGFDVLDQNVKNRIITRLYKFWKDKFGIINPK